MIATDMDMLLAAVRARPRDEAPRLILADWLQENGRDAEADGWRWLVAKRRWPCDRSWASWTMRRKADYGGVPFVLASVICEIRTRAGGHASIDAHPLGDDVREGGGYGAAAIAWYPEGITVCDMFQELVAAWAMLSPRARKACWKWEPSVPWEEE